MNNTASSVTPVTGRTMRNFGDLPPVPPASPFTPNAHTIAPPASTTVSNPDHVAEVVSRLTTPVSENEETTNNNVTSITHETKVTDNKSCFTIVDIAVDSIDEYSKEYSNNMNINNCVADQRMLLKYMVEQERALGVALSFRAVGVDTIVFDTVCTTSDDPTEPPMVAVVPDENNLDEENNPVTYYYEKITVDGEVYLSCLSDVLDSAYLHQIITDVAEALYTHGIYTYTLIGPRPLRGRTVKHGDHECQQFIETLKLNSYELSVLIGYVQKLGNINISYGEYNGHQAIFFERVK